MTPGCRPPAPRVGNVHPSAADSTAPRLSNTRSAGELPRSRSIAAQDFLRYSSTILVSRAGVRGAVGSDHVKRASAHVGRVGGLAVALGIGAAVVTGGAATAWAVPDGSRDSAVSADASSPADPTSSSRADSTPTAERSRWNRRATPAVLGARDSGLPERKSDPAPQAKAVPSAVAAPNPVAAPHALRAASRLQTDRVQLSAVAPAAVTVAVPAAAGGPLADQRMAAPIAVAPTAAAPIMVAAPPTAAVNFDPISLLGSGSGSPVQSPVSWAVLAVARRQLDESETVVPHAVTVSTALPTA